MALKEPFFVEYTLVLLVDRVGESKGRYQNLTKKPRKGIVIRLHLLLTKQKTNKQKKQRKKQTNDTYVSHIHVWFRFKVRNRNYGGGGINIACVVWCGGWWWHLGIVLHGITKHAEMEFAFGMLLHLSRDHLAKLLLQLQGHVPLAQWHQLGFFFLCVGLVACGERCDCVLHCVLWPTWVFEDDHLALIEVNHLHLWRLSNLVRHCCFGSISQRSQLPGESVPLQRKRNGVNVRQGFVQTIQLFHT